MVHAEASASPAPFLQWSVSLAVDLVAIAVSVRRNDTMCLAAVSWGWLMVGELGSTHTVQCSLLLLTVLLQSIATVW